MKRYELKANVLIEDPNDDYVKYSDVCDMEQAIYELKLELSREHLKCKNEHKMRARIWDLEIQLLNLEQLKAPNVEELLDKIKTLESQLDYMNALVMEELSLKKQDEKLTGG